MARRMLIVVGLLVSQLIAWPAQGASFVGKQAPEISLSGSVNYTGKPSLNAGLGRVVLLEFWATWCPPCRRTIPHLQELHKKYHKKGLFIVSVSSESRSKVKSFVGGQGSKMSYPIGIDENRRTASTYGIRGIPHAFLIDTKGKVIWEGHPLTLKDAQITDALKSVDLGAMAPAPKPKGDDKTFHLKDGRAIAGRRLGAIGDLTMIKTQDGKMVKVPTGDIVKVTDGSAGKPTPAP